MKNSILVFALLLVSTLVFAQPTTDVSIASVTYSKYNGLGGTTPAVTGEKVYFTITMAQLGAGNNLSITDPIDLRLLVPTNIPGASYSPPLGNSVNVLSHGTIQSPAREHFEIDFDGSKTTASIEIGYLVTNPTVFNSTTSCIGFYLIDTNLTIPNGPTSYDPNLQNNYVGGCYPYGNWTYTGPDTSGCTVPDAMLSHTLPEMVCHTTQTANTTLENIGFKSYQKLCGSQAVKTEVRFRITLNDGAILNSAQSTLVDSGYVSLGGKTYHEYYGSMNNVNDTLSHQFPIVLELYRLDSARTIYTQTELRLLHPTTGELLETQILNHEIEVCANVPTKVIESEIVEVKVFPNPVSDVLHLEFGDDMDREYVIEMFTITGQLVHSQELSWESHYEIPVYDLNKGVYLLRVTDKTTGASFIQKVVVSQPRA